MDINGVISISYLIIGFVLSLYWFDKEYEESYNAAVIGGEVDKGMSSIMMICLMMFWPIKVVKDFLKKFF